MVKAMCVKKAIEKVIEDINRNPFVFRNETDIQARLYYELCTKLNECTPKHETNYKHLKMNRVHCEYYGGKNQSIDVVVLDEDDIINIAKRNMKKEDNKPVIIDDAIEIKIEQGNSGKNLCNNPIKDIIKLKEYKDSNLANNLHFIYIVRWDTKKEWKQDEILDCVKTLEKKCKDKDISFYTNDEEKYFFEE